ncbi:hypothetical protein WR25_14614 [Diploscapter pachys]|uniref:Uncharacterized protein n=1 Tax=Diploscapter pachys TaxID=2018661 RepID=A0A2A2KMW2_9BILA|nr:hypothetical protein WR25_14614 [Diploscapter pachys]
MTSFSPASTRPPSWLSSAAVMLQGLGGGNLAALVVQFGQVDQGQRPGGGDQARAVVQVGAAQVQREAAAEQLAGVVVQALAGEGERVLGFDAAAVAVAQRAGMNLQRLGADQALEVVQALADPQQQTLVAEQAAVAVVQLLGSDGEGLGTGNLAALVGHGLEVVQLQRRRIDQAATVVQVAMAQVEVDRGVAEQLAALLVEAGDRGGECFAAAHAATVAVIELARVQVEGAVAADAALAAVVQVAGAEGWRWPG